MGKSGSKARQRPEPIAPGEPRRVKLSFKKPAGSGQDPRANLSAVAAAGSTIFVADDEEAGVRSFRWNAGKGRFVIDYRGEVLSGEATRVSGDQRKGVASAYSPGGSYMSCEYQMSSPYQGAGTCTFSNGARYQVHIGN